LINQDLQYLYSTAQLALMLGIGRSTVNKYARSLESAGYVFLKDSNGHRTYSEHDIVALRALSELLTRGVEYDSAVNDVVARYKAVSHSESVLMVASSSSVSDVATLNEKVDELIYVVGQLNNRISEIVDERVRSEVASATAGISGQVQEVLTEVRAAQERSEQQFIELGSSSTASVRRF
jgi:biotin operon repressor/gas vesicle protein